MFYVVSYVLMTLAGFGIIIIVIFDQIWVHLHKIKRFTVQVY
jgi:hypothetical protein